MPVAAIRYRVVPKHPEAHIYEVTCTVEAPDPAGQCFALPAWAPGSYMIREYSRHVLGLRAQRGRRAVALRKLDKHSWQAEPGEGPLTLTAEIYAWDLSVRGAHLDQTHAFFNGPCLFLRVLGQELRACEVEIVAPRGRRYAQWQVATAMRRKHAPQRGFGIYQARDYDELIDHPVEMGRISFASFKAHGVVHDIAITGRHQADLDRLCRDLKRVCEWQIDLFGRPAPMDRYIFLVTAVGEGYGGLEHRASSALLCSRDDLPTAEMGLANDSYRGFLGLCSHEYFHSWNVKRIKPAAFTPYDLDAENYTSLLWAFEGITSYYDDLALARTALFTPQQYLEALARAITQVQRGSGRLKQSVSESSWDAWIKYYRQDENAPNAIVSYYNKGSLIALCLDALLRSRTRGRKSLNDVMRALWLRYGQSGEGVPEDGVERMAEEIGGLRLRSFFDKAVRGTAELPLKECLAQLGIEMELRPAESATDKGGKIATLPARQLARRASLGARTAASGNELKLLHVYDAGAAQLAGLSAGDVIVALNGLRVSAKDFDSRIAALKVGTKIRLHVFRRDELHEFDVVLQAPQPDTCVLRFAPRRTALQRAWLDEREA